MSRYLVESIRYEKSEFYNILYHQRRMEYTYNLLFKKECTHNLKNILEEHIDSKNLEVNMKYKVRVVYDDKSIVTIEFLKYNERQINSLCLVHCDTVEYSFKFEDRSSLINLYNKRGNNDDIIIVQNGLLTDAYSSNIALFDGENWLTPENPLLPGTQRQFLLDKGIIIKKKITDKDIDYMEKITLFNCMNDFKSITLPVSKIER